MAKRESRMGSCVLVVGDELEVRARIARALQAAGHKVELAEDVKRALKLTVTTKIEAAIVAMGREPVRAAVAQELHGVVPKLIVLADPKDETVTRPDRSRFAADAVLLRPLDERQLLARLSELPAPSATPEDTDESEAYCFEDLRFDVSGRIFVDANGREVSLTRSEADLLLVFVRNPRRVLSRDRIRRAVAGLGAESYDRSVDMLVARLRRKVEPEPRAPRFILTVPGGGYKFTAQSAQPEALRPAPSPGGAQPRRLAAILAADIVGFSRLMGEDEEGTLSRLKACRGEIVDPKIAEHRGRIVKTTGDGTLVEFASVVDAVRCAVEINAAMAERNADLPKDKRIEFRIGINIGDIIVDDTDIYGDGVNIAARLEGLADPGGICLSQAAADQVRGKLDIVIHDMGERELKNIARPVRVYRLRTGTRPVDVASAAAEAADKPALALPDKPSLAVLPFQNMSSDPEQEYFADGIVEDLTTALSRVRSFFVIARNSSFTYKGKAVDVRQVGRELGVRYVLEGSVRKAAGRVRITCQLVEAAMSHHVWADRFEGKLEDIFDLQDRVTESIVGTIEPSLQLAEVQRAALKPTDNLTAYDLYLQALPSLYSGTEKGIDRALQLLYRAIAAEPNYALAKAMAAYCYVVRIAQIWARSDDERAEGIRLAREASRDNRDEPTTLSWTGMSLAYLAHDYETGMRCIDRSLALNPSSATNYRAKGYVEMWVGNLSAAQEAFRRAIRLSPLDPEMGWMLYGLANSAARAGDFEEGLRHALAAVREQPGTHHNYLIVIQCLVDLGRITEAREFATKVLNMRPAFRIGDHVRESASRQMAKGYVEALRLAGLPE
jgi:adenylate cyclase